MFFKKRNHIPGFIEGIAWPFGAFGPSVPGALDFGRVHMPVERQGSINQYLTLFDGDYGDSGEFTVQ